jgi:hypothetical protein
MWLHMYSDGTSKIGTLYECMRVLTCTCIMYYLFVFIYLETEVVINSVDEGKHEARGPTRTPVVEVVFESTYNPLLLKRLCPTQRRHWSQLLQHICERLHYICETVELQLLNHQELTSLRGNIY